jgi:hypothetical protein
VHDPAIHIAPDESFDDRVVPDDCRYELGHFPTRESAELAGRALAQKPHGGAPEVTSERKDDSQVSGGGSLDATGGARLRKRADAI